MRKDRYLPSVHSVISLIGCGFCLTMWAVFPLFGQTVVPDASQGTVSASPTPAPTPPIPWPTTGWETRTPEEAGMRSEGLAKAVQYVLSTSRSEEDRKGIRTDGFVIIRHGWLVREGYARGYDRETRHLAWSMSKSFVNALFGIAVKDGLLDIRKPAAEYYPPLDTETHRAITLDHLLRMSSGLYWNEGYEASPLKSSVIAMLYTSGRRDMALFAASQPLQHTPGEFWQYSSGTSNLLMGILRNVVGEDAYPTYPWDRLFSKIGMNRVVWERDGAGNFVGSSYLYATPRDMAKFGYLYLRDGQWEGEELLPESWIAYTTELAPAYRTMPAEEREERSNPGAHWWLNVGLPESSVPRPYPDAPPDTFAAFGHWGQSIFVIPSLDLVVVRTGDDRDGTFDRNQWLKLIIDSIEQ